jgi:predicted DNA-binding antitoxin AbrB/MazE fold protein
MQESSAMSQTIRAVYDEGQLRLLDRVDLKPGQHVTLSITPMTEEEALRAALGDIVRWADPSDDSDAAIEREAEAIKDAVQGTPLLSEVIIEERGGR